MSQYSRESLEKIVCSALIKRNIQVTDYNINYIVHYILKAENIYNPDIGSMAGFVNTYIKYGLGMLRREINSSKKEIPISSLYEDENGARFDHPAKPVVSEESELFSHIKARKMLTEKQESVIYRIFFLKESEISIAESLGVSHQAVNHLKIKALEKLRCLKSELL